jgi:hypothetical protein
MNAARAQPPLDDLKALAGPQHDVVERNAHVAERDVAVAVRRVVVAKDAEHAVHRDAGRVRGHQHDRLLAVCIIVVWVALAHDDVELAAGVAGTAAPPFLDKG